MSQNLVQTTTQQVSYLESIGSTCRFSVEFRGDNPSKRVCELVDIATGNSWNKTLGEEWQETFDRCIETSRSTQSLKPKTAAELAQDAMTLAAENARLREMVEAAQASAASAPKRKAQTTDPS